MENKVIVTVEPKSSWKEVRDFARKTIGKEDIDTPVSRRFKTEMLACEHSPIRELSFRIYMENLDVFVAQQFTRHSIAMGMEFVIEPVLPTDTESYQATQRPDRTGIERSERCNLIFKTNAQGLIDMSKKRLCFGAWKPSRDAWLLVKEAIKEIEPLLGLKMQPSCIHLGGCPELRNTCLYYLSEDFKKVRKLNEKLFLKVKAHD